MTVQTYVSIFVVKLNDTIKQETTELDFRLKRAVTSLDHWLFPLGNVKVSDETADKKGNGNAKQLCNGKSDRCVHLSRKQVHRMAQIPIYIQNVWHNGK